MDADLLRRPGRLLCTWWPVRAIVYLAAHGLAGIVSWVCIASVLLFPFWARAWGVGARRLVGLMGARSVGGLPERGISWRDVVNTVVSAGGVAVFGSLGGAVAAVSATTGEVLAQLAVRGPGGAVASAVAGIVIAGLLLWALTCLAAAHARMTLEIYDSREQELRAQVESLATSSVQAQDRLLLERRLLQQRLHDGAQLQLSTAGMRLGLIEYELEDAAGSPAREDLLTAVRGVQERLEAAMADIREASHGLAPRALEEGLCAALNQLADDAPLPVRVTCEETELAPECLTSLYLVASEALTNVVKHAHATQASIVVTSGGRATSMVVTDDGVGGADPGGSGLLGIAARARLLGGSLDVSSPAGGPTVLRVELPG